ncbi:MAG: DoxX family protein [Bryobacteraceae bacterium]
MQLRIGAGIALICPAITGLLSTIGEPINLARNLVAILGGIFLLAGLWTPVIGTLLAIEEVWIGLALYSSKQDGHWMHLLLAVLTAAVAMVGPGAWSIDARLFGRKRFAIGDPNRAGRVPLE